MDAFLYRVKAAQRDLIDRCGGIMRSVDLTGFAKSQVGRWHNPLDSDIMPPGAIRALEADCGNPMITAVMAEACGRRLADPDEERRAERDLLAAYSEMMRLQAEVVHRMAIAISDGHVSPAEATAVDRALAKVESSTAELRSTLAVIKARGGDAVSLRLVSEGQ